MSAAPPSSRPHSPEPDDQGAAVMRRLLLVSEAGVMFAVFWITRPLERIAPRLTIWVDRWMGRMLQQIELVLGTPGFNDSTKGTHGQG